MAFLQERSAIERSEAISGRKAGNTREYLIFPVFFMLETVRQTERNQLSLSEFKVISMVISIKTSTIQAMEIKFQENGENLVLLTAEILLPPAMSSCFLRVLLCRKGSPMVEFLTENLLVSLRQLRLFSFGQFRSRSSSFSHSAISSDGLFTYKSGCFLSTDFRFDGGFLGVFSSTKQNFVGIASGFKLTHEEPGIFRKRSVSKWSPHSLECSLTGVFVRRIFASHLESNSLFSSGKRYQDFFIFMSEEFVQP